MKDCFIIMPITIPEDRIEDYGGDADHFAHVLECIFIPALSEAGFNSIPPKSKGSNIIQADIIQNLASADLVLCDMSILNPNVFFEFGIRTALDKPVVLVVDDQASDIPFDPSIINYHKYDSSLKGWTIPKEVKKITGHIQSTIEKESERNALWKYFGIAQSGVLKPEDSTVGAKLDLLMHKIDSLEAKEISQEKLAATLSKMGIAEIFSTWKEEKEKIEKERKLRAEARRKALEELIKKSREKS